MIVTNFDALCDDVTGRYILMGIAYPDVQAMSSGITAIMSDRGITDCHMYYINAQYNAVALIIARDQFAVLMAIVKDIAINRGYSVDRTDYSSADRVDSYVRLHGYDNGVARKVASVDAIVELTIVDDTYNNITVSKGNSNNIFGKKEKIKKIYDRLRILRQIEGLGARHEAYITSAVNRVRRGITDDEADEMLHETLGRMRCCMTLDEMLAEQVRSCCSCDGNTLAVPSENPAVGRRPRTLAQAGRMGVIKTAVGEDKTISPSIVGIGTTDVDKKDRADRAKIDAIKMALRELRDAETTCEYEVYIYKVVAAINAPIANSTADNILADIGRHIATLHGGK